MDIKNVFKQEAKRPPPQWAFITQEVREKFSPKKVRTRLKYKNQAEKTFFPVLKLNTNHKIGTKAIKIKMGNEFGGHEIKNNSADNKQKRILKKFHLTLYLLVILAAWHKFLQALEYQSYIQWNYSTGLPEVLSLIN